MKLVAKQRIRSVWTEAVRGGRSLVWLSLTLATAIDVAAGAEMVELDSENLLARGEQVFNQDVSCWVCHGEKAEGRIGPSLAFGPSAADILRAIYSVPQMSVIQDELAPTDEDLVGLSVYIGALAGLPSNTRDLSRQLEEVTRLRQVLSDNVVVENRSSRDALVEQVESFDSIIETWTRKAKRGSIRRAYDVQLIQEFDPGRKRFNPQPDSVYFYENLGNSANLAVLTGGKVNPESTQVVVGDAGTRKIIASYEIPRALRSPVHTTVLSADGKYVYIVGSKPSGADTSPTLTTPATILKVDAFSLQPVKQLRIGGRLHHGQLFRDSLLLLDTFSREPDGLDVMVYDPATDSIVGGLRDEDLGGISYTAWTNDEHIFVLMEPTGYTSPYAASIGLYQGRYMAMKPFWVAKVDPDTWEVVREYPYPGYRGNWIVFDSNNQFMYVMSGGSSNVAKIDLESGEVAWASATGIGPYGASLTLDESELWVADKGESAGMYGRTVTIIDTDTGQIKETVFSGYEVDHILLAPNGREMWATSNGEGRIYVFDVASRSKLAVIEMPQNGDPHGLVWVAYDSEGVGKVVRDQGHYRDGANSAGWSGGKSTRQIQ